jgi:hypothetical protein
LPVSTCTTTTAALLQQVSINQPMRAAIFARFVRNACYHACAFQRWQVKGSLMENKNPQ